MKDGAAMGKLAYVNELPGEACLNSHLLLFRPKTKTGAFTYISRYMFYFMCSRVFQNYVQVNGTGSTFLGVSQQAIENYAISLPPLLEQQEIAEHLDSMTTTFDNAISRIRVHIDRVREYRTRLIAEVVTGKVDVRDAAAGLPEEEDLTGLQDLSGLAEADIENEVDSAPEEVEA